MSHNDDLYKIRDKLINVTISTATLFLCLALIPSLSRYFEIGWNPVFLFHIGISGALVILFALRKKIPLSVKSHSIFLLFMLLAIVGIINFRTVGGAYTALVVITLCTMLYGLRMGIVYSLVFIAAFVAIGFLQVRQVINPKVSFNEYVNLRTTWFTTITAYVFMIIILLNSVNLFYTYYIDALNQAREKSMELVKTLDSLIQSDKKYRSIFEGSKDGLFFIDEHFKITSCNRSYTQLAGYDLPELKGQYFKKFMYNREVNWDSLFLELASSPQNKAEVEIVHKSGEVIPAEVTVYRANFEDSSFLWAVVSDLREKKFFESEIFSAMIRAEENERERYAKELHDGLGPLLSTSMIYLFTINEEQDLSLIKEYAGRAYSILEDATKTVKEISNNLSPIILREYGMVHAVRSFIEKAGHVRRIHFSIDDELTRRYPEVLEFTIYRILVELINNSLKHSGADEITISFLKIQPNGFLVRYHENGAGFDYHEAITSKSGFGLLNLKNRIHKIGGDYSYQTAPGQGVQVSIKIPNYSLC